MRVSIERLHTKMLSTVVRLAILCRFAWVAQHDIDAPAIALKMAAVRPNTKPKNGLQITTS